MLSSLLKLLFGIMRQGVHGPLYLAKKFFSETTVKFWLVNLARSVLYFIIALVFVKVWNWPLYAGNAAAYVSSFILSYLGHALLTFRSRGNHLTMFKRFAVTQILGLAINFCIIGMCVSSGLPYALAMLVAILAVPPIVYYIYKYWVFTHGNDTETNDQT